VILNQFYPNRYYWDHIDALAYILSWALNGTAPAPPGPGPYDCSLD
jgi:hypothetical protein